MTKKIWFDMDGTIADLYAVSGWLELLRAFDPTPYAVAKPLVRMTLLSRQIRQLQALGYEVGIISWGSKESTPAYDEAVKAAKMAWLAEQLPAVKFDAIHVVPYGTNKWDVCGEGILFDDEERNRLAWQGEAYEPEHIYTVLTRLAFASL